MTSNKTNSHAAQANPDFQRIIDEIVDTGFVGIQLRVTDEHREWAGTAGLSALGETAPPPSNGRIRIGSNTKTFVATAVLQLVAEGQIALDTPAAHYLPHLAIDPRITVRMLLQHTSGIFNFTGEVLEDGTIVPGVVAWSGKDWVDNRLRGRDVLDLVRQALALPARFEPGTDWSYSNTNYAIARLLIEAVTGDPLAQVMQRQILEPLGLTDTLVPENSTELGGPHAHAYYRYDDAGKQRTVDVTVSDPSWISSGGDMISTSKDLHTFIRALVTGKLLPAPLLADMLTPESKVGYGLGVIVQHTRSGTVITHNGGHGGHAALMYSTADGSKTMTAALNYVDDADLTLSEPFQQATQRLIEEVFGGPAA
ncbi:serine hydrolase domain-containing protein [Nocardia sp. NPDC058640]|uniref:serine hydrolase domain-containing protein n=1 Tax=Nocardia sp. NPDC058640 TaxID=3346571 RepID=UPI003666D651